MARKTAQARLASKPKKTSAPTLPLQAARVKPGKARRKPRRRGELPQWTTAEIAEAFRRFEAANPVPRGELEHINPFTLLVAVVLSAQATDAGVNKATPALFKLADTPAKMAKLGEARVRDLIKTIGLFRTKAKNLVALSQKLVARTRRQGPARPRRAGSAARRRPQDRERGAQRRLRRADHRRRHPHLPRRQPHRACRRQDAARGRNEAHGGRSRALPAARPPLAHPAWPLRVRRPPPAVRKMHHRRSVQVAGKDGQCIGATAAVPDEAAEGNRLVRAVERGRAALGACAGVRTGAFRLAPLAASPASGGGKGTALRRGHVGHRRSAASLSCAIRCSAARSSLLVEASGSSSTNQTKRGCW